MNRIFERLFNKNTGVEEFTLTYPIDKIYTNHYDDCCKAADRKASSRYDWDSDVLTARQFVEQLSEPTRNEIQKVSLEQTFIRLTNGRTYEVVLMPSIDHYKDVEREQESRAL